MGANEEEEPIPEYTVALMRKMSKTSMTGESIQGGWSYRAHPEIMGLNFYRYSVSAVTEEEFKKLRAHLRSFLLPADAKRTFFFKRSGNYEIAIPKWIVTPDVIISESLDAIGKQPSGIVSR